jgi:hypothetical protein
MTTFFLNRFRLGIAIKPVDWLKFYAQGQDSEEFRLRSSRYPGAMGAEGDNNFDLRQAYIQLGPKLDERHARSAGLSPTVTSG